MSKTIGTTEFFQTLRGAKNAATLRRLHEARVYETSEGFALLADNEETCPESETIVLGSPVVAYLDDSSTGRWQDPKEWDLKLEAMAGRY